MRDSSEKVRILLELSMAIGTSLNSRKMLQSSLSAYIKKLNCFAGGFFSIALSSPEDRSPREECSIPRKTDSVLEYRAAHKRITTLLHEGGYATLKAKLPMILASQSGTIAYIFDIPDVGLLILVKTGESFSHSIIKSLQQINLKLANAYKACLQNQELLDSQVILERKVKERTIEIQNAYDKLKQAQKQLVQSEKMASLGQLAAGVAHEINNPTGYIMSNLSTMEEYVSVFKELFRLSGELIASLDNPEAIKEIAEQYKELNEREDLDFIFEDVGDLIRESVHGSVRIKDIVRGLKDFARVDSDEYEEADLNKLIQSALNITWNRLKYKCEVDKDFGEIGRINCIPNQLVQVFINILVNASDAIESNGKIRITTRKEETLHRVDIQDNGTGIDAEDMDKLFDPFFTTKEVGKGTGLGLSISHGIIEKHGGEIQVKSSKGEGTTFSILLP